MNRYLLDRNPKVIGTQYATAEKWKSSEDVKGILLDKDKRFSVNDLENMKAVHTELSLSFLVEENLESHP